jgi:hypothetical protein
VILFMALDPGSRVRFFLDPRLVKSESNHREQAFQLLLAALARFSYLFVCTDAGSVGPLSARALLATTSPVVASTTTS